MIKIANGKIRVTQKCFTAIAFGISKNGLTNCDGVFKGAITVAQIQFNAFGGASANHEFGPRVLRVGVDSIGNAVFIGVWRERVAHAAIGPKRYFFIIGQAITIAVKPWNDGGATCIHGVWVLLTTGIRHRGGRNP